MSAEQASKQLVDELVRAWNSRDGAAFSCLFAEDADYVTGSGARLAGRESIRDALFGSATNRIEPGQVDVVTESIKALGQDAAVILCMWQMSPGGATRGAGSAGRQGLMTIVTHRAASAWHIIALQNTDKLP
jgi:uncharacterized protein (TIGR02246 family)